MGSYTPPKCPNSCPFWWVTLLFLESSQGTKRARTPNPTRHCKHSGSQIPALLRGPRHLDPTPLDHAHCQCYRLQHYVIKRTGIGRQRQGHLTKQARLHIEELDIWENQSDQMELPLADSRRVVNRNNSISSTGQGRARSRHLRDLVMMQEEDSRSVLPVVMWRSNTRPLARCGQTF